MVLIIIWSFVNSFFVSHADIRGQVLFSLTKEPIPFATVKFFKPANTSDSTQTDFDGHFSFKFRKQDVYRFQVHMVGFNQLDTLIKDISQPLILTLTSTGRVLTEINFDSLYNERTAKADIKNNQMKIVLTGKTKFNWRKRERFEKKYRIKFKDLGCDASVSPNYNKIIGNYLDSLYHNEWQED